MDFGFLAAARARLEMPLLQVHRTTDRSPSVGVVSTRLQLTAAGTHSLTHSLARALRSLTPSLSSLPSFLPSFFPSSITHVSLGRQGRQAALASAAALLAPSAFAMEDDRRGGDQPYFAALRFLY